MSEAPLIFSYLHPRHLAFAAVAICNTAFAYKGLYEHDFLIAPVIQEAPMRVQPNLDAPTGLPKVQTESQTDISTRSPASSGYSSQSEGGTSTDGPSASPGEIKGTETFPSR